ncbi:MAG: hypothetical protein ACFFCQ_13850 [Promethearchaeota archaeon]
MRNISNYRIFAVFILISTSLGIVLTNTAGTGFSDPSQQEPRNVYGIVKFKNGTFVGTGIIVTLTNLRTNENLTTTTNENGYYIFDLQSLPSPYYDGDPLQIKAQSNNLAGQAYGDIDISQPGLQIDVILEKIALIPYRIWGYTYFDNYTLIEKSVTITITNQRTDEAVNILSSIIGKYEYDISSLSLGYQNLDTFQLDSTFRKEWHSSAKVTINLGNTKLESIIDLFFTNKNGLTTSSFSMSSYISSMTSTSKSKRKSPFLDLITLGIAVSILPLLRFKRTSKEKNDRKIGIRDQTE